MLSSYTLALLVVCYASRTAADEDQASFQVKCDGNVAIQPPPGGSVEVPTKLLIANASSAGDSKAATIDVAEQMNLMLEQMAAMQSELVGVKGELVDVKGDLVGVKGELADVKGELADVKGELVGVKGELVGVKGEVGALVAAKGTAAEDGVVLTTANMIGGDVVLDFTPGAELEITKTKMAGIAMATGSVRITGTGIASADVTDTLQTLGIVMGNLFMQNDEATFAGGDDAAITFRGLRVVGGIAMQDNGDDRTARSLVFSKLTAVGDSPITPYGNQPGEVYLHSNKRLESVRFPKLEHVAGEFSLSVCPALARVELPQLVATGTRDALDNFALQHNPLLTTDNITVSPDFHSIGRGNFLASNSGFTCTDTNGLAAVAAACRETTGCTNYRLNPTSCK